jgi:hypothetical protein
MLKKRTILITGILLSIRTIWGTTFESLDFSCHDFWPLGPSHRPPKIIPVPLVSDTWTGQLSETEAQAIDRTFPHLGFGLAWHVAQLEEKSASKIFGNSLADFDPRSGSCKNMKKGIFAGKIYILKPKNGMGSCGSYLEASYRYAHNEIQAGAQIRQAVVNTFLDNGRNLDIMLAKFGFLIHLVAPIDCGDHIASLEVPNAIPLHDIVYAQRKQFLLFPSKQLSGNTQSPNGFPIPNFGPDDAPLIPRKTLFPNMNFGQARERIRMVQKLLEIINFLHVNKIAHNDLHSGNFLIQNGNYTQIFFIDFDKATWGQKFSPTDDRKSFTNVAIEYIFGSTKKIPCAPNGTLCLENLKIFQDDQTLSYTDEKLERIKKILLQLQ